jgi:MFS superfamily sulfate permease-like transporter
MTGWLHGRLRFDRNELSGAFGDIGTDFPLLVGMILVAGLDVTSSLVLFGAMQIFTGLFYGIPMPAEPLKAMAVIVITQKVSAGVLYGGGLAIGILMLLLTLTGLIDWLARAVPKVVVRGIQLGLGLQLAQLALKDYVPADSRAGFVLAGISFVIIVALLGNRRFPPAVFVILLGVGYGLFFKIHPADLAHSFGLSFPHFQLPAKQDILTGLVILAIPQLPLSLGNSILATRQVAADFYPERSFSVRQISTTYSLMNLVNPFFGGVPTCHGSGGMVGHYTFGARTGGSVVIYGAMYLALGLFLSRGFSTVIELFPKPVLGVILLFEGLNLIGLIRDMAASKGEFLLVILTGLLCVGLPYGYVVGLVIGTLLAYLTRRQLTGLDK